MNKEIIAKLYEEIRLDETMSLQWLQLKALELIYLELKELRKELANHG